MEHALRDPLSQFVVGTLTTVIGIIVMWIIARGQQHEKRLEYRSLTSTPIVDAVGRGKFALLFQGEPVEDVQLIIIRFGNAGNVEIIPSDYHEPVTVEFSIGSRVLSAEVTESFPAELNFSPGVSASRVTFPPVLLNAGDWFTVKCLVARFKEGPSFHGRISGVKAIRVHSTPIQRIATSGVITTFSGLILGLIFLIFDRTRAAGVVLFALGYLSMIVTAVRIKYWQRRDAKLFG